MFAYRVLASVLAALGCAAFAPSAGAADLPRKALPKAAVVYTGGYYIWADASYESIPLPVYDLGWFTGVENISAVERHRPRVTGAGVTGGVGYFLPPGILSPAFGANARIEASVHYTTAQSTTNGGVGLTVATGAQLANGALFIGVGCNPAAPCTTTSRLKSDYSAWRLEVKGASDFKFGLLTLTPSVALFGGATRTDQDYLQVLTLTGGLNGTYTAGSEVDWADIGVKAGLQAGYDVTNAVTVGARGTIGVASRRVHLSIADSYVTFAGNIAGTLAKHAEATPFLANVEASLLWQISALWSARVFGGWNYDSRVPGIVRPNIIGGNLVPAAIDYEALTSWYVGGGASMRFGS